MYKVKNITKNIRKFTIKGKNIFVNPNEYILTNFPPEEASVWEISINKIKVKKDKYIEKTQHDKHIEKMDKQKLNIMEVENGSSSSR